MGYAPNVYQMITHKSIKNSDDDQLFYTKFFLDQEMRVSIPLEQDIINHHDVSNMCVFYPFP